MAGIIAPEAIIRYVEVVEAAVSISVAVPRHWPLVLTQLPISAVAMVTTSEIVMVATSPAVKSLIPISPFLPRTFTATSHTQEVDASVKLVRRMRIRTSFLTILHKLCTIPLGTYTILHTIKDISNFNNNSRHTRHCTQREMS